MSFGNNNLEALKVGDLLAYDGYGREVVLIRVEKVTPTQVVTGTTRWSRKNGRRVGASSSFGRSPYGRVPTADDLLAARVQRARRKLGDLKVTPENIDAVETLLKGLA